MSKNSAGYVKVDAHDPPESYDDVEAEQEGDLLLRPILHDDILDRASSHDASKGITDPKSRTSRPSISSPVQSNPFPEDQQDRRPKHPEGSAESIVAKVVPETDDPSMLTNTIRVWLIGGVLGAMGAGINQIFFFKSNGIGFGGFFITLVSYAAGKLMAASLPAWNIPLPNPLGFMSTRKTNRWFFEVSLNPGEFSVKEHMLIGVLAGCASSAAYAGDIVAVQDLYYHQDMGHFGALLLILSTQLLGFGLAGLTYSILIRPTAMIWPSSLVVVTLYNTLHAVGDDTQESREFTKARMRFFTTVFLLIFVYQFLPSVFAPTLTSISIICIINNRSTFMRVLGSAYTGAGLLTLSLDWTVIGSVGSLYTPFFASFNYFAGMAWSMWILVPLMWYCDFWNNRSFGDNAVSARLFDQSYNKYNVSAVVKPDFTLDEQKFQELGPIQLTPYFAASYGVSFAVLTSAVMTVFLFHSEDIKSALSARNKISTDVHVEIMERNYENVPMSWYAWIGGTMFLASIFVVLFYPLQCPVWALLLALGMATFFIIPMGIIKATTNTQIGLNVITEFVAGILLPGKPLANITFKVYGFMTMSQCLDLAADLKLGIYAKVPPKDMFIFQIIGTSIGAVINYIFIRSVIADKRDLLDGTVVDPSGQWTGRKPEIFYSASVIWGLIGPLKFFSGKYRVLFWGFPIGALLPIIPWFMSRNNPKSVWRTLSIPLFLHGAITPPQIPTNVIGVGFLSAFLSQYWALKYRPKWFEKYNYVLSSALDAGTSLNALAVYMLGLEAAHSWWNPTNDAEHCKPGS
ncbi:OPT family small oligopeptide transporter [Puccinia graminis f. sp. tritici CRL 75-36-700-3]|uniref:OPT family small oligopeptide transporter n=1 Tax=Puccinia graminis f. sp. tritici (strain CRL 75-36-700-3 / race SCCL) TaxID=418459 RepID=H6QPH2_PUCGT|nr:OPT family small oligopeptide transporter [Puccinia graminis f. sp. tritici CRL 75-36-700-3]EHS63910.1 OPT family small oligopeptide transporter [Puccinia graminis f. sp. tritici CRL 75-36-700-3]